MLDGHADSGALFAYGLADDDEVQFAALRTPPHPWLASPLDADPGELVELWLQADPEVAGVTSVPQTARAIAAAWAEQTGGTARRALREAMHILDEVRDPPRPAAGELRLADAADRSLLIGWLREFVIEAGVAGAAHAEAMVDARMRRDGLLLWQDELPVAMVGVTPEVAGVVRIGPVYTPPPQRRRGYAGSAVAAVEPPRARTGSAAVHALHRSRQPDVEQDLRGGRLRAGGRLGGDRARACGRVTVPGPALASTDGQEPGSGRPSIVRNASSTDSATSPGRSTPARRSESCTGELDGITRIIAWPRACRLARIP